MNGTINIFKPRGITSHDVVHKMREILGIKKIGHAGSLDPNATGVLLLGLGKGTRVCEYLLEVDKEYIAELTLGLSTDTQDKDGRIIRCSSKKVNLHEIHEIFSKYRGVIEQVPPMYSALKLNGKKLYELAREGITVDREARMTKIYDLEILRVIDNRKILFRTKCSKGTYIRTLCHDIGQALGTYGYMSYLIRTKVGNFDIKYSYGLDYLDGLNKDQLKSIVCPIGNSVNHLARLVVEKKYYSRLINGNVININKDMSGIYNSDKPIRIYCANQFIGIGKIAYNDDLLNIKMDKVLI